MLAAAEQAGGVVAEQVDVAVAVGVVEDGAVGVTTRKPNGSMCSTGARVAAGEDGGGPLGQLRG